MQSAFEREKVDTTTVPFKGGADAINVLLGGHIDAVVSTISARSCRQAGCDSCWRPARARRCRRVRPDACRLPARHS
ncbi:hypothetical protein [Variovorax boronicumulans]